MLSQMQSDLRNFCILQYSVLTSSWICSQECQVFERATVSALPLFSMLAFFRLKHRQGKASLKFCTHVIPEGSKASKQWEYDHDNLHTFRMMYVQKLWIFYKASHLELALWMVLCQQLCQWNRVSGGIYCTMLNGSSRYSWKASFGCSPKDGK